MNLLPVQFRCFTNCCFYARSQGEQVCMQRSLRAVSQLPMAFWIFLLVFKDRHFGAHLSDAHSKVWVAQYGAKLSHSSVRSSGFVRFPCCHTEGWVLAWLCLPLLLSVCGPFIICWEGAVILVSLSFSKGISRTQLQIQCVSGKRWGSDIPTHHLGLSTWHVHFVFGGNCQIIFHYVCAYLHFLLAKAVPS